MGENGRNIDSQTTRGTTTRDGTTPVEQVPGIKNVECSNRKKKSLRARYAYGVIFLLTNIIGWLFRDYGEKILPMLPYSKACGAEERECYHTMGVLRVSLGCFIFFFTMFVSTCYTKKLHQARSAWHSGYWALKSLMLLVSFVVPFFIPTDYVQLYGDFSRVGAGVFLILQLISVIEFITWWNNYWMPNDKTESSCSIGLFMSTLFYVASVGGIVAMYVLYAAKTSCTLNIFFISWTAVLLIVMMVVSLNSKVNRGLLSSGIMASYIVYLCWAAIRSEPGSEKCSHGKQDNGHSWSEIVGFVIALCVIVMATFSTGIDSESFQFRKHEVESEEDDIPYGYGFFHLVFSLGAMYFAMLFVSWNLSSSLTRKWSIDVGWASTWVKIVNEWFAATIYLWKLIFPVLKEQAKVMNHDDQSNDQLDKSNAVV